MESLQFFGKLMSGGSGDVSQFSNGSADGGLNGNLKWSPTGGVKWLPHDIPYPLYLFEVATGFDLINRFPVSGIARFYGAPIEWLNVLYPERERLRFLKQVEKHDQIMGPTKLNISAQ